MSTQLQRVKERLSKYKEDIDQAEEREIQAKNDLIEAKQRGEHAENEVKSMMDRLELLKTDFEKVKERLETSQKRLDHAEGRYGDDDEMRQEFEATELERDEQLAALEEECVAAKKLSHESNNVLKESQTKLAVVEDDCEKTSVRLRVATERLERLEGHLSDTATKINDLEERDSDAAQREELSEEKMKFLTDQLKEMVNRAENAERDVARLDQFQLGYQNELNTWRKKKEKVDEQFSEIADMADATADEHERSPAAKSSPQQSYEPDSGPESDQETRPEPEEPQHSEGSDREAEYSDEEQ